VFAAAVDLEKHILQMISNASSVKIIVWSYIKIVFISTNLQSLIATVGLSITTIPLQLNFHISPSV
jgi:hypothetical protein